MTTVKLALCARFKGIRGHLCLYGASTLGVVSIELAAPWGPCPLDPVVLGLLKQQELFWTLGSLHECMQWPVNVLWRMCKCKCMYSVQVHVHVRVL